MSDTRFSSIWSVLRNLKAGVVSTDPFHGTSGVECEYHCASVYMHVYNEYLYLKLAVHYLFYNPYYTYKLYDCMHVVIVQCTYQIPRMLQRTLKGPIGP